jgi:hypothetical protein
MSESATEGEYRSDREELPPLQILKRQRSHLLFVMTNAAAGKGNAFEDWYQGPYRDAVSCAGPIINVQHYRQHEVDITAGHHPRPPFGYMGIYELSLDGAQAAEGVIEQITALHREDVVAQAPATWLYYPVGEKVGRSARRRPSLLTLAFANSLPGRDVEFREWYITRHIRHALNVPALVSGQCFERSQFQKPGSWEAAFSMIAVYEQEDTAESILESFATLPESTFAFPTLDGSRSRFAESVYRPL